MQKILITGASGFVGQHLISLILQKKKGIKVLGIDKEQTSPRFSGDGVDFEYHSLDLNDSEKFEEILKNFKPTAIVHLAALSSVGKSWKKPAETFLDNTNIFFTVLEAVRLTGLDCRVLSIGSSEEYGIVNDEDLPLTEGSKLHPTSPYAVSSMSKQYLSDIYVRGYGMDIVRTRSFNHLGPGQTPEFFIPSIAWQLTNMKEGKDEPFSLKVGNLSIIRDYTDVRDVVRAYWKLLMYGNTGETYNVCSGRGVELKKIVNYLIELTGMDVEIQVDDSKLRPVDNPKIIGSNKKIRNELGWSPKITLKESLRDITDSFRNQIV